MDKFIVAVVPNEAAAHALLSSLQNLDIDGSIELYTTEVLAKEPDGKLVQKTSNDTRGLGTAVGAFAGGLIGLLAGPVGLAVGAVAGGAGGFAGEAVYSGVSGAFISSVAHSLAPGEYAVFVEAFEDWTFPLDEAVRAVGGRLFRQATGDVVKAQMKADDEAGHEEIERLDAEIARAQGDAKATLEQKRAEAAARHEQFAESRRQRSEQIQKTWDARVASVRQKAKESQSEAKRRHEAHAQKLSSFVQREKTALKELFS